MKLLLPAAILTCSGCVHVTNVIVDGSSFELLTVAPTGSMVPTLNEHCQLLVNNHFKFDDLKVGDIVIFKRGNYNMVHRIVRREGDRFFTMGDHNQGEDFQPMMKDNFVAKVIFIKQP